MEQQKPTYLDDNGNPVGSTAPIYLDDNGNPVKPKATVAAPAGPAPDSRTALQVLADQADAVRKGIPQAITGIPGMLSGVAQAAWGTAKYPASQNSSDLIPLRDFALSAISPLMTVIRGGGALNEAYGAPHTFDNPSRQEWESAAQGGGAMLGGALMGAAAGPLARATAPVKRAMVAALGDTVRAQLPPAETMMEAAAGFRGATADPASEVVGDIVKHPRAGMLKVAARPVSEAIASKLEQLAKIKAAKDQAPNISIPTPEAIDTPEPASYMPSSAVGRAAESRIVGGTVPAQAGGSTMTAMSENRPPLATPANESPTPLSQAEQILQKMRRGEQPGRPTTPQFIQDALAQGRDEAHYAGHTPVTAAAPMDELPAWMQSPAEPITRPGIGELNDRLLSQVPFEENRPAPSAPSDEVAPSWNQTSTIGATRPTPAVDPMSDLPTTTPSKLTPELINRWMNVAPKQVVHGANPGMQLLDEGLVKGSKLETKAATDVALKNASQQMQDHLQAASEGGTTIDATDAVNKPLDAIQKRFGSPKDKAFQDQIQGLRDDVAAFAPNLDRLTPLEAHALKVKFGEAIKWTGDAADTPINEAMIEAYRNLNKAIKDSVPGIDKVQQRWGNLYIGSKALGEVSIPKDIVGSGTGATIDKLKAIMDKKK
jgi:hypothetical protein